MERKAGNGQCFCLYHPPAGSDSRGTLLYIHPFAEEMNKSRRMAALQSRAFAAAGYAVLQIDLHGCGDSSGDFGEASWAGWLTDIETGLKWLRQRHAAPLWLWGLRAGCLLAAEAAAAFDGDCELLLWQPAGAGNLLLQQFLRLKMAGELADGKAKGITDGLKQKLGAGQSVDIAGYQLSASLASGMETARLGPSPRVRRVEWLEVSTRADATLSPASSRVIAAWQDAGVPVRSRIVEGPAFWQTTEIEEAPALVAASLAALEETHAHAI